MYQFKITAILLFFAVNISPAAKPQAQYQVLPDKFDDFQNKKSWWQFHRDGTAAQDDSSIVVNNGFLYVRLKSPSDRFECNTGISEPQNIYGNGVKWLSVEIRLKLLTAMYPGSRGWGFWKMARDGKAGSLAWFMEQMAPGDKERTWSLTGTVFGKNRSVKPVTLSRNKWHIYKIERDLHNKNTIYYIDGREFFRTPGLVPAGKLSFHLWIDNQVYSSSQGISRRAWDGLSALVVDYVRIRTERSGQQHYNYQWPVLLHEKMHLIGNGGENQVLADLSFNAPNPGKALILITARTENGGRHDEPDKLKVMLNGEDHGWLFDGNRTGSASDCLFIESELRAGIQNLKIIGSGTPVLSGVTVIAADDNNLLINNTPELNTGNDRNAFIAGNYSFRSNGGAVTIFLSGAAGESPEWNHIDAAARNDDHDDDLKLMISDRDFGWQNETALYGNRLFGSNDILLIQTVLPAGMHNLKLITNNTPTVHRIIVCGN